MQVLEIPVKKLDESLEMPAYAYAGDAGFDLRAAEKALLEPFERKMVSCGISIAIPKGYAGFILPRSGLAIKQGLSIVNAPGLIDSNYRGEIKVLLINLDAHHAIEIKQGDRVAQLVIMEVLSAKLLAVSKLDDTIRGSSGFGSSGIHS